VKHKGLVLLTGVLVAVAFQIPTSPPSPAHINNSVTQDEATKPLVKAEQAQLISKRDEVSPTPAKPTEPETASTCASEVAKYDWPQTIAHDVMMAESRNNPDNHNDDASTGDYSIGCFQINLLGEQNLAAKYRDSKLFGYTGEMTVAGLEQWLKVAKHNVAVAHYMWQGQGWIPWELTCKYKVRCE
jgi:hypothetical protein